MRLIDADALYNGTMKDEYFDFVAHDKHGRESFAYSCAMQRLAEAPTIDAIPVEWLKQWRDKLKGMGEYQRERAEDISFVLGLWQKEAK